MRTRLSARAAAAAAACVAAAACADRVLGPEPSRDPAAVFDAAWQAYDRHFAFFADKQLDWDLAYAQYRPLVPAEGGTPAADSQLFAAVCGLVRATGSLHSTLAAAAPGGARTCAPDPAGRVAVDPALVRGRYLSAVSATPSGRIVYGPFSRYLTVGAASRVDGGAIGYVAVPSFGGAGWGAEVDDAVAALERVAPLGALVVDVRGNGGGDDATARVVASRFADRERVYALRRYRTGPARDALGPAVEARVGPAGRRFAGRVVVLTDRGTASAAESFVMMLRVLPNVVVVGDTTSGTASLPLPRQLPNGWWLRVPASLELTPDGRLVVEGRGLPPAVPAPARPGDLALDADRALGAALTLLTGYDLP